MSFKKLNRTNEQILICEKASTGKDLFITALAGASKSTSGKFIADYLPNKEILTIFFNKANADEGMKAKDKPANMYYSTIHSIAYSYIMNEKYRNKLSAFLDYKDITKEMYSAFPNKQSSKIIRATITLWQQSDYHDINLFIKNSINEIIEAVGGKNVKIDSIKLSKACKLYWKNIIDENHKTKITHDTYLKLFHLQKTKITHFKGTKLDIIIFDECLTEKHSVKTDKGLMFIKRLYTKWLNGEELPNILSYNIEHDIYEYKPMLSAMVSHERETLKIKTEGLNVIECTPNHKILTGRGYVMAGDLIIGEDYLLLDSPDNQKSKYILGEEQYQVVIGSILGDGSINTRSKYRTFRLGLTQGEKQLNYLKSKANCLGCHEPKVIRSGYTGKLSIWTTHSKTFILHKDPMDCIYDIDARGLAIWYMDDGTISKNKFISIASNSFNYEEHIILLDILAKNFELYPTVQCYKGFYQLAFNKENSKKLLLLTAPYMHFDLAYKNPYMSNESYVWKNDFKNYGGNFVSSIESIGKQSVYDIEVQDNHNFCTHRSIHGKGTGIIVHNCQDLNSVNLGILKEQTHLQRIACGDANQQLYTFRGATGCIELYKDWDYATLTESFRFGENIADMANKILDYRPKCKERLIGAMKEPSDDTTVAILCRTNASVLVNVFKLLERGEKVHCITNLNNMYTMMYHIFAVMAGQKPQFESDELKGYDTKELMQELLSESPEMKRIHNIALKIADLNDGLDKGIKKLKDSIEKKMSNAKYIVSTIHGSKGLGFGTVIISNDLISIKDKSMSEDKIRLLVEDKLCDNEFSALLYVAITRAKNQCIVPEYLKHIFE